LVRESSCEEGHLACLVATAPQTLCDANTGMRSDR
jgi:hypothetical protein